MIKKWILKQKIIQSRVVVTSGEGLWSKCPILQMLHREGRMLQLCHIPCDFSKFLGPLVNAQFGSCKQGWSLDVSVLRRFWELILIVLGSRDLISVWVSKGLGLVSKPKLKVSGENLGRSRLGLVSFSKEKFSFTSLAVSNMVCMPIMDE